MSARRFALTSLAVMLLLQAAWILLLPPLRGMDEIEHVYRASAVAHGEWVAGEPAHDGAGVLVTVPEHIRAAAESECVELPFTGRDNCFGSPAGGDMVRVASGAGGYEPVFYWVLGTAARPFEGVAAVYAMRVVVALASALLVAAGCWCLAVARVGRWTRLAAAVAITPVAVYSTTIIAPNGPEIAAGFLAWSALLAASRAPDLRRERVVLGLAVVALVLLAGLRLLGPGFALIIVGLVGLLDGGRLLDALRRQRSVALGGAMLVAGTALAQLAWHLAHGSPDGPAHAFTPLQGEEAGRAAEDAQPWWVAGLLLYPLQTIAAFPFRNQPAPLWVYPVFLVVFATLLVVGFRAASPRHRAVLGLLCAGTIAMPYVLTVATMDVHGVIWQGRYGLPLAIGIPLLAGLALAGRVPGGRAAGVAAIVLLGVVHAAGMTRVLLHERDAVAWTLAAGVGGLVLGAVVLLLWTWWTSTRAAEPAR